MNIIDGINIVGFIQFNNMGIGYVEVYSVEFLVSCYWGYAIYLSVFDRYFYISHFHNIIENTQMQNKSFSMFHEIVDV